MSPDFINNGLRRTTEDSIVYIDYGYYYVKCTQGYLLLDKLCSGNSYEETDI